MTRWLLIAVIVIVVIVMVELDTPVRYLASIIVRHSLMMMIIMLLFITWILYNQMTKPLPWE